MNLPTNTKPGRPQTGEPGPGSLGQRHWPLNRQLAEELRQAIVSGRYLPGERLVEGRLADDFGVSRIPVREALRTLASEGLVRIEPRKGASVASMSDEVAREMIEVRATLEGLNARLAARHCNAELIARLQAVLANGDEAAATGSAPALSRLNTQYHDLLAQAGMNSILGDLMRQLRDRTMMYFNTSPGAAARSWREHAAILHAIIAGDEELACARASRHVRDAGRVSPGANRDGKAGVA